VSTPARGRPPEAAARRAGLEFVEKLLTSAMVALLDGAEREHAIRVPPVASLIELASGQSCASPWSPSPSAGVAQLLGHDLDGRGRPAAAGKRVQLTAAGGGRAGKRAR
jgi:hypothetical protein